MDKLNINIDDFFEALNDEFTDQKIKDKNTQYANEVGLKEELVTNLVYLSSCIYNYKKAKKEHFQGGVNFRKFIQEDMSDTITDIVREAEKDPVIGDKIGDIFITITNSDPELSYNVTSYFKENANIFKKDDRECLFPLLKITP